MATFGVAREQTIVFEIMLGRDFWFRPQPTPDNWIGGGQSKTKVERKLNPSGGARGNRQTEKQRTEIADKAREVRLVEHVEGVNADGDFWLGSVLSLF